MQSKLRLYDRIIVENWLSERSSYWDSEIMLSLFDCECGREMFKLMKEPLSKSHINCEGCGRDMYGYSGAYILHNKWFERIPIELQITTGREGAKPFIHFDVTTSVNTVPQPENSEIVRFSLDHAEFSLRLTADILNKQLKCMVNYKENYVVNPVLEPDWPYLTLARFFRQSMPKTVRMAIQERITDWRHDIEAKMQKHYGPGLPTLFVHNDLRNKAFEEKYGIFFSQLQNIAWRVSMPEAPNYNAGQYMYLREHWLGCDSFYNHVLTCCSRGDNYIDGCLHTVGAPTSKTNRKLILRQQYAEGMLGCILKITKDQNYIKQISDNFWLRALRLAKDSWYIRLRYALWLHVDVWKFLEDLANWKGVKATVCFLDESKTDAIILDICGMYHRLNYDNKILFWKNKPRIKHYHETLTKILNNQDFPYAAFKFYTPEMQYFLPNLTTIRRIRDTRELGAIADAFKNCVRSYTERIKKGTCEIYGYYEPMNKPVICIEICRDESGRPVLMQAKGKNTGGRQIKVKEMPKQIRKNFNLWINNFNIKISTEDV